MIHFTRRELLAAAGSAAAMAASPDAPAQAAAGASASTATPPTGDPATHALQLNVPADTPLDALLLGNGRLGAMVFGQPRRETLVLNEDSLWSGQPHRGDVPNGQEVLHQIRQAVFAGDYAAADRLSQKLQGRFSHSYAPLASLHLDFDLGSPVRDYRRTLDFDQAVARVEFSAAGVQHTREVFASHPAQLIVLRFRASRPGALSLALRLSSLLKAKAQPDSRGITLQGKAPTHCAPSYQHSADAVVYADQPGLGMHFATRLELLATDGRTRVDGEALHIEQAGEIVLAIGAATGFKRHDQMPDLPLAAVTAQARAPLKAARGQRFDSLRAAHVADHRSLYRRMSLVLGSSTDSAPQADANRQAQRYFNFNRYLLIACSRPGTQAANLQGIWSWEVRPPWSCNYTTNINVQQNYWSAHSCNLAELAGPMLDFVEQTAQAGRVTARQLYGAKGWCAHHNSDLWRLTAPVGEGGGTPTWANWAMAGPWLAQHLWEHFLFGQDREFLAQRAYPVLKGCAEFCADWLVRDPRNGRLTTAPSVSTENRFREPGGAARSVSAGCTMDIALVREVFSSTAEAARLLGVDGEFADHLTTLAQELPPYRIGRHGQLQEWEFDFEEPEPEQRHISHLYPVSPGCEITPRTHPELARAAGISMQRRLDAGGAGTGWSRSWAAHVFARLGDGQRAYDNYMHLLRMSSSRSLLDLHPSAAGPLFQIDGNLAGGATVVEMLLQSHGGVVSFLPALPAVWGEGALQGVRARGDITLDMTWRAGRMLTATLQAGSDGAPRLRLPAGQHITAVLRDGQPQPLEAVQGDCRITLHRGGRYELHFA